MRKGKNVYKLYDSFMTYYILGGLALWYVLSIGLCCFFTKRFLIDAIRKNGSFDGTVLILYFIFLVPLIAISVGQRKEHGIDRYFVRCTFDKEGIHCFGLFWKAFDLPWENIRTYGLQGYSFSYCSIVFLFFNTEKEIFKDKKQIARISNNRVVFQFRDEIIPPLMENMPEDMKKRLKEAVAAKRDCFVQR